MHIRLTFIAQTRFIKSVKFSQNCSQFGTFWNILAILGSILPSFLYLALFLGSSQSLQTSSVIIPPMRSFLHRVKSDLTSAVTSARPLRICIGNEAADADSIISSLCYAYAHDNFANESKNELFVPLVQVDRRVVHLRGDVEVLLQRNGMTTSDLLCFDELPDIRSLMSQNLVKFSLLDHNSLSAKTLKLFEQSATQPEDHIVEILDHHKDNNLYQKCSGDKRCIAFDSVTNQVLVGSTCTLVHEKFNRLVPASDKAYSTLLLGVILLDSLNMDPVVKKGTPRDQSAISTTMEVIGCSKVDADQLFASLQNAKNDIAFWQRLTSQEAFEMDYKDFDTASGTRIVGISSVLMPLNMLLSKANFVDTVDEYLRTSVHGKLPRELIGFMALFSDSNDNKVRRQLMLISKNNELLEHLCNKLVNECGNVGLIPINIDDQRVAGELANAGFHIAIFDQSNLTFSRKQIAPLVQANL